MAHAGSDGNRMTEIGKREVERLGHVISVCVVITFSGLGINRVRFCQSTLLVVSRIEENRIEFCMSPLVQYYY